MLVCTRARVCMCSVFVCVCVNIKHHYIATQTLYKCSDKQI